MDNPMAGTTGAGPAHSHSLSKPLSMGSFLSVTPAEQEEEAEEEGLPR